MRILLTYICLIGVLITTSPIFTFAQFNGGNGNGYKMGSNITYCTPLTLSQLSNIAIGSNSDGYGLGSNLTYCTPTALPQLTNVVIGGNSDGYGLGSNLTYCTPVVLPQLSNIVLGGNSDGYGIGSNLTYCTPVVLPQLTNIVLGGNGDGYSMMSNLTYCTPVASYSTTASSATATSPICLSQSSTLGLIGGSLEPGANWYWYTGSCGGAYVISGASPILTPTVTTTYYVRAEGLSNTTTCVSITVVINTQSTSPTSASASPANINSGSSSTLSFSGGSLGGGANWVWYSGLCGGTSIGTGTLTTQSPTITTVYYVRAEGACNTTACVSTTVTVNSPCTSSVIPTSASVTLYDVCGGIPNTLFITGGSLGTSANWYWYTSSCGGTSVGTGASTTQAPLITTLYYIRAEGTCNTTSCISLEVSVLPASDAATSLTATLLTMCTGDTSTLGITGGSLGANGDWYWYTGSCGGTLITNGLTISVSPSLMFTNYYVRAEGMCNTTTCVSVRIRVNTISVVPSAINATSMICNGTNDTLTKVSGILGTNSNWFWYSGSCGGTFLGNGDTLIINQTATNVYYIRAEGQCNTTSCVSIVITNSNLSNSSICGNFTYPNTSNTPLDSLWVFLMQNGNIIDSVQANINGNYCFYNVSNGTYNVTATTHKAWGGVNITDVVRVKRHFSGSTLFTTSYTIHAGDVNNSMFINVTDGVKISRRFAGSDTSFVRGDWDFEKPTGGDTITVSTYMNDTVIANGGNITQNFKGVCIGDVNGSYTPSTGAKESGKIMINYSDIMKLNPNEYFELPLAVNGNYTVAGISLILNYPKDLLQIEDVKLRFNDKNEDVYYHVKGNELRIGWFETEGAINMNDNGPFIIIKLKTTNNFKSGNIINFKAANNYLCELADDNGDPINNVIMKTYSIEHINNIGNVSNLNLYPNPADEKVNINYSIANDGLVKISLYNILGEKIADIINYSLVKGTYNTNIDLSMLPPAVYTFKMKVNDSIIVKRLIISR